MAEAGDRAGIALQGIDYRSIHRGCYASSAGSLKPVSHISARVRINRFFNKELTPGLLMHVTVGMSSIQAKVFPYRESEGRLIAVSATRSEDFTSYVELSKPTVAEPGDRILFSLLSLPPTTLRIAASGAVLETPQAAPTLKLIREKPGIVNRLLQKGSVVVEGLAKSRIGAERIVGEKITTGRGAEGTISSAFGTKGLILATFDQLPEKNEKVLLRVYREFRIR
jgi:selenocysteine-specific elongation factor